MTSMAGVALDVVLAFRAVYSSSVGRGWVVFRLIRRIIRANDLTVGFSCSELMMIVILL